MRLGNTTSEKSAAKGDVKGQLERRRERNAQQEQATGIKAGRSSSGITKVVSAVERKEFAEIEDQATHLGDFVAQVGSMHINVAGAATAGIAVPVSYQQELIDAVNASRQGFVMVRVYFVPRPAFIDEDPLG